MITAVWGAHGPRMGKGPLLMWERGSGEPLRLQVADLLCVCRAVVAGFPMSS